MNRYIRTKDGKIYDTATEWKNIRETHSLIVLMNKDRKNVLIYKADTKQADAIEELCDEFVIYYCEGWHLVIIDSNDIIFKDCYDCDYNLKRALGKGWEIYGSIWVDGNLIKVAKMNGKGEFKPL